MKAVAEVRGDVLPGLCERLVQAADGLGTGAKQVHRTLARAVRIHLHMDGLRLAKDARGALVANANMGVGTSGAGRCNFIGGRRETTAACERGWTSGLLHAILASVRLSTNACKLAMISGAAEEVAKTAGAAVAVTLLALHTLAGTRLVCQCTLVTAGLHVGGECSRALLRPNLLVLVCARGVCHWQAAAAHLLQLCMVIEACDLDVDHHLWTPSQFLLNWQSYVDLRYREQIQLRRLKPTHKASPSRICSLCWGLKP